MPQPKLLEKYRERLRVKHYSLRTEDAYLHWVRRYIYFHGKRHPQEMGGSEVEAFLSHLATEGRVSPSTQNQAALLFLYREVLEKELPWMDGMVRAKRPARVPVVLTGERSAGAARPARRHALARFEPALRDRHAAARRASAARQEEPARPVGSSARAARVKPALSAWWR